MNQESSQTLSTSYQTKRRIVMWFTLFTVLFYVLSLIITIAVHRVSDFSITAVEFQTMPYASWSTILSNLLSAAVCIFLVVKLYMHHKVQPTAIKLIFMAYLFFSGFPALIVGLNTALPPADLNLHNFFSIAAFFLIPCSTFFLVFFVIEIFVVDLSQGRNKLVLTAIGITCVFTYCISLALALMGATPLLSEVASAFLISFGLVFIVINLVYYFLLAYKTLKLGTRTSDARQSRGLKLMGYGGIVIGLIYLFRIILGSPADPSVFVIVATSIVDFQYLLGYVLLYLGVTIPMKKD